MPPRSLIVLSFIGRICKSCITITWMIWITCATLTFHQNNPMPDLLRWWGKPSSAKSQSFSTIIHFYLFTYVSLEWLINCLLASSMSQSELSSAGRRAQFWPSGDLIILASNQSSGQLLIEPSAPLRGKRRDRRVNYSNEGQPCRGQWGSGRLDRSLAV